MLNNDDNGRFYGEIERENLQSKTKMEMSDTFCNFATGFLSSSALITQYLQLRLDFFSTLKEMGKKNLEAAPSEDLLKKQHRKW